MTQHPSDRLFVRPSVLPTSPRLPSSPATSHSLWDGTDPLFGGQLTAPVGSTDGGAW